MNKRIPFIIALICIFQYANQGISSLPDQCLYYLLRENWKLSATMLGLISWITGLAWYLKIGFGYCVDNFSIKGKRTTYYLIGSYLGLLLSYLYIVIFGLNLLVVIISGMIINICIAFADVSVDREMVICEQKQKLKGRLQAIQWTALGIAGLVVSLGGAGIAKYLPEPLNYKIAYGIAGIIPLAMLVFLFRYFKEKKIKTQKVSFISNIKKIANKRLIMGLIFIAFLNFCPSFGTPLMIKVRESLGVDKMFLGYLGAMGTVLGVIGYFIYYKWVYKFPIKKLIYFMIIFTAITNLFYLYIPNQWVLLAYNLIFGAFGGITFMTLLAFFVKIIPTGGEGFFYALVTSVNNFAARGGNFLGGYIYDKTNYNTTVIVSTVFTLFCLLLVPLLKIGGANE
jgi:hypothetical protein